jgi:hypothetical protein
VPDTARPLVIIAAAMAVAPLVAAQTARFRGGADARNAAVVPRGPYDPPRPADGGADAPLLPYFGPRRRDAGRDVAVSDAAVPLREVSVGVASVDFENGDVPRAQAALERFAKKHVARCVNEHGWRIGRRSADGDTHVDLRFLVRAPGRAEGVDVASARGVPPALVRCIATALANRVIGAPSSDPVAVSVRFKFR